MLERARALLQPSARSGVPAFMVMDVMAAAERLEAQGRTIVHMEVGQPAAGAPASAIAAVRAALGDGQPWRPLDQWSIPVSSPSDRARREPFACCHLA